MSVLIKNMEMPKGCIYANDNDQTEYCPLLNHDDVPFCQYIESEPEIAIGIDERPVYCPLSDVPEPCENTVSRQAAIDAAMQYCPDDDGSCSKADRDIRELLDDIENLPSAQLYKEEEIQAMQDLEQGRTQGMIDTKAEEVAQTNLKPTCKQLATDTISRRAAIDAVKKNTFRLTFAEEQNCEGHVAWSAEAIYSDVIEGALLELPSAQPELIEKAAYIRGFEQGRTQGIIDTKAEKAAQQEITLEFAIDYLHSIGWMQKHDKEMTDSAYTEGYTQAEAKYRALWDEMQANIKEKAFGKRKGLIHTADIDSMPTIDPKPIKEGLLPDGTLHLFTDTDLSKVDRVWVSQNGTHFGDLYYADGEPKIGKWERHYSRPNVYADLCWHCSNCGYKTPDNWANKWKFCPNCGARMQEGEDNDRA